MGCGEARHACSTSRTPSKSSSRYSKCIWCGCTRFIWEGYSWWSLKIYNIITCYCLNLCTIIRALVSGFFNFICAPIFIYNFCSGLTEKITSLSLCKYLINTLYICIRQKQGCQVDAAKHINEPLFFCQVGLNINSSYNLWRYIRCIE